MFVKKSPEYHRKHYSHALYEWLVNLQITKNIYVDLQKLEEEGETRYQLWRKKEDYRKAFKHCCNLFEEFSQISLDRDVPPVTRSSDENSKVVLDFLNDDRKRRFFIYKLDVEPYKTFRDIEILWELHERRARK